MSHAAVVEEILCTKLRINEASEGLIVFRSQPDSYVTKEVQISDIANDIITFDDGTFAKAIDGVFHDIHYTEKLFVPGQFVEVIETGRIYQIYRPNYNPHKDRVVWTLKSSLPNERLRQFDTHELERVEDRELKFLSPDALKSNKLHWRTEHESEMGKLVEQIDELKTLLFASVVEYEKQASKVCFHDWSDEESDLENHPADGILFDSHENYTKYHVCKICGALSRRSKP